jgi:hypothetical protein
MARSGRLQQSSEPVSKNFMFLFYMRVDCVVLYINPPSCTTACPIRYYRYIFLCAVTTVPFNIGRYADCKIHRDLKVALYREMISLFDKERGNLH